MWGKMLVLILIVGFSGIFALNSGTAFVSLNTGVGLGDSGVEPGREEACFIHKSIDDDVNGIADDGC
jgi:hypothetical protein